MPVDLSNLGGWRADDGHVAIASTMPSLVSAPLYAAKPSKPILLYKAWKDVLGKYPDYPAQTIGECVSFGHGHANDLRQCVEIALGEPSEYRETDTEFIYGMSRKIAGILGAFDGSYGAAAVKAMTQVGIVSREMLGANGAYSGQRAKSWGYYGPPAEVEAMAAPFKTHGVAKVSYVQQAISILWSGCPFTICSSQGFTLQRDKNGFCQPSGRWDHCMFVCGWRPNPEGFLICQSWGPNSPQGPLGLDQPSFSFWCDPQTMQSILNAGDSWAIISSPDFIKKKRKLPASFTKAA
jgi:hypothetical protein